jgi:hypothetical protein
MKRIFVGLALLFSSLGTAYAANSDSVLMDSEVRVSGNGALTFPDGIEQTTAATSGNVVIGPANINLKIADTQQLTATSFDSSNNQFPTHSYIWKSVNPTIASINSTGLVTAISAGTAIITVKDTINNVVGQLPLTVKSVTGDWVATNIIAPNSQFSSACTTLPTCRLHLVEAQNRTVTGSTIICKDNCNNTTSVSQTGKRTGSLISLTGTLKITPPSGSTGTYTFKCLNTWDGNNNLSVTCISPNFPAGPMILNHQYVRGK